MKTQRMLTALAAAVLIAGMPVAVWGAQSLLLNGSMEKGEGSQALDPMIPADWELQGNVIERSAEANLEPSGAGHALKAFQSDPIEQANQYVAVAAGDSVLLSAWMYTKNSDHIGGDAQAGIALRFYDQFDFQVGSTQIQYIMTAASPSDTWTQGSIGPIVAPSGAVTARVTCIWNSQNGNGAVFWDDVQLTINGGSNLLLNGDFEEAGIGDQSPTGIENWTGFNDQEASKDFAYVGTNSLKIGTTSDYSGLFQNMIPVAEGDHLLIRTWLYQSSSDPLTGTAVAGPKLEFSEADPPVLPPPTENLGFGAGSSTNAWELVEVATVGLEVPEDATSANLVLIYVPDDAGSNGTVYFDAVNAYYSSNPGTNLALNASFEDGDLTGWSTFSDDFSTVERSTFEVPGYPNELFDASLSISGTTVAGASQNIPVTPGEFLNFTAYARKRENSLGGLIGTARAGVKVEWAGGSAPSGPVDICDQGCMGEGDPTDQWVEYTIDYTMPAGTAAIPRLVNLVAFGGGFGGTGTVYFDGCEVVVLNRFDGADADADFDADLYDYAAFQRCFSGDGVTPLKWPCTVFDSDDDNDVDLVDFDYFRQGITGPVE